MFFLKKDKEGDNIRRVIKNVFGFRPGNIFLYKLAFSHRSMNVDADNGKKINNERLEYLGDAVLGAIVADYLFKRYPLKNEGFMTEMRSKIVCRDNLNKMCIKMGLNKLIAYSNNPHCSFKSMSGDAFEALIGAIYLDKGYNFTHKIVVKRIININLDVDVVETERLNSKSQLYEWSQKNKKVLEFRLSDEKGKGNSRQYFVDVIINDEHISQGCDFSIKGAEKIAAFKALKVINDDSNDDNDNRER